MKPISLKLRGAVGIRDGLHLDQIEIDLTQFSPGLVCIVGSNGSGKTTIMDNLHPFLELPSRNGTLADHFFLRDSSRDFVFEMNGIQYRSHILIDGDTGKSEAYLYCNGNPQNDGKIGSYKAAVEQLVGSPDLYFRSIFSAQGASSITSLSTAKRKELFFELLGLQVYEHYFQVAATRIQAMETELAGNKALVEASRKESGQLEIEVAQFAASRIEMEDLQERIKKDENELNTLQVQKNKLEKLAEEQNRRNEERLQLQKDLSGLELKLGETLQKHDRELNSIVVQETQVQQEIQRFSKILSHREKIVESIEELRRLRAENEEYAQAEKELVLHQQLQTERELRMQQALNKRSTEQSRIQQQEHMLLGEEQRLKLTIQSELAMIARQLSDARKTATPIAATPCKESALLYESCGLLVHARKAFDEIPTLELKQRTLESEQYYEEIGGGAITEKLNKLKAAKQQLLELEPKVEVGLVPISPSAMPRYDQHAHGEIRRKIERFENDKWEELAVELQVAESVLNEKRSILQRILNEKDSAAGHCRSLVNDIQEQINAKKSAIVAFGDSTDYTLLEKQCSAKIETLCRVLDEDHKNEIDLRVQIATCEKNVIRLEEQRKELEVNEGLIRESMRQIEDWRTCQRACSKDGIPALELDAAGPAVSKIANDLLASSFGVRFQIAFETTKPSKDGKKQLETFAIRIMGDAGEKHIEDLSGGERVWIERAISEAIAIYLSQKSGKEYLTTFQDESDGALDPDNKQNYLRMLQESFRLGRRHFTFVITQSPEIWEQVEQRIHLSRKSGLELVY